MDIKAKEITLFPTSKLSEYPRNANKHTDEQINKIIQLIEFYGHRDPLIVDADTQPDGTHWVLAGNGRLQAAKKAGWDNLPCVFQVFKSDEEKYGFMVSHNAVSASSWGGGLDLSQINTDIIDLGPDFDIDLLGIKDFVIDLNEEEDEVYTRKVESPIYTPSGEKPSLNMLYDTEVTDKLLKEIEDSSLPSDIKLFLKLAAHRHTKFNYKNIAEYYAHASPEEQNLIEKSALVIIDFDKAIELGFVKLTADISEAYDNDE